MIPLTDFHVIIFEAIPSPIFILDRELSIIDFNEAAVRMSDPLVFETLRLRTGEFFGCVHSAECGAAPECRGCAIRLAAREAMEGRRVCRKAARLRMNRGGEAIETDYLVTAVPFEDGVEPLVLMIVEDIEEMIALRDSARRQAFAQVNGC